MLTNRELFAIALNRINDIAGTHGRIDKDKQGWFIVDDDAKETTSSLFTDTHLRTSEMFSYLHGVEVTLIWCRIKARKEELLRNINYLQRKLMVQ